MRTRSKKTIDAAAVPFVPLLAAIDDRSLQAIIGTIDELPGIQPALQAWIEHAARWEADRRTGFDYTLQGPMAAISPEELPDALAASALLAECFRHERRFDVSAVLAFFESLRDSLRAEGERTGSILH